MQKRDLCMQCFEATSPGVGVAVSPDARCQYSGGQQFCASTDFLAIATGREEMMVLCMACNQELLRFTGQELEALPEGLPQDKQLEAIRKAPGKSGRIHEAMGLREGHRMSGHNESCQPTPGGLLLCFLSPLTQRGCTLR